jgi:Hemerythrin HHE cation binding domain
MTVTETRTPTDFRAVTFDLYRDVHKGIRTELFRVTAEAGRMDPSDRAARAALDGEVTGMVALLVDHAAHEDAAVQPALETHLPDLAEQIEREHQALEHRMGFVSELAGVAVDGAAGDARGRVHHLYVDLAAFTSAYLAHQDVEERTVMPALETAVGLDAVLEIHQLILAAILPEQMAASAAMMLPAMNVDDCSELLGGMQAGAPAEVFAGMWGLVQSVLPEPDVRELGVRLGIA